MGTLKPAPPAALSEAPPGDRLNSWNFANGSQIESCWHFLRDHPSLRRFFVNGIMPIKLRIGWMRSITPGSEG